MGYMGFGMQKWIYRIKPRKPFSKERKPYCDSLPKHTHENAFNEEHITIIGRTKEKLTEEERKQQNTIKYTWLFVKGLMVTLAIGIFLGLISHFSFREDNYFAQERYNQSIIKKRQLAEKEKAYQILLKSGNNAMLHKNYKRAINEFDQAMKISNGQLEARELLSQALMQSCSEEGLNCERALKETKFLFEMTQKPEHRKQLQLLYLHLGQFEEAERLNH